MRSIASDRARRPLYGPRKVDAARAAPYSAGRRRPELRVMARPMSQKQTLAKLRSPVPEPAAITSMEKDTACLRRSPKTARQPQFRVLRLIPRRPGGAHLLTGAEEMPRRKVGVYPAAAGGIYNFQFRRKNLLIQTNVTMLPIMAAFLGCPAYPKSPDRSRFARSRFDGLRLSDERMPLPRSRG